MVDKDFVKKHKKVDTVINERNVLQTLKDHPFVVKLFCTFQDSYSLYYVLEQARGGELYDQLARVHRGAHAGAGALELRTGPGPRGGREGGRKNAPRTRSKRGK